MVFYAPIATLYRSAVGVTISQIAVIESISLVLSFVFELPWGILADRIGYKKTIIVCNALYFVSKLVFWKATGFFGFFAERVLLAIVISGLSGVDVSILYLSSPPQKSHKVFSIYSALGTAGLLLASLVYSVFIGSNFRSAAALTVLSYGAAALLSLLLKEVRHPKKDRFSPKELLISLKSTIQDKKLLLFLLAFALFSQTYQSVTVFFSQLKFESLGASSHIIGAVHIVITLAGLVSVFSEKLTKTRHRKALVILPLLGTFFCVALATSSSLFFSAAAVILIQGVFSIFEPLKISLESRMTESDDRATALSINTIITDSTSAGISVMLGYAAEKSLSLSFVLCAVLCCVSAVIMKLSKGSIH
ncbi:MAG: MFS transporter [Oscillospiraceae bacterium]|nr:MFS transporter [Oscillospiraceae bacterium]